MCASKTMGPGRLAAATSLERIRTDASFLLKRAGNPCRYHSHLSVLASISSRHANRCKAGRGDDSSRIPVVDDATVLPPPPTGSQYAWRRSWAGSGAASSNGNGGDGGPGGRNQSRTRDWGSGPHSSLLFFLMYRMRMLLLYGAWVTVLYGALRAVMDLSARIGKGILGAASYARGWAASQLHHTHHNSSSREEEEAEAAAAAAAASDNAAAAVPEAAAVAAATQAAGQHHSSGSSNGSKFACINAYLQERPGARLFNDLMTCVIPLYLMLLGSVVFFASM